jgi:hypothetical protein
VLRLQLATTRPPCHTSCRRRRRRRRCGCVQSDESRLQEVQAAHDALEQRLEASQLGLTELRATVAEQAEAIRERDAAAARRERDATAAALLTPRGRHQLTPERVAEMESERDAADERAASAAAVSRRAAGRRDIDAAAAAAAAQPATMGHRDERGRESREHPEGRPSVRPWLACR